MKQEPFVVIIYGPPGSGKGTQAERISQSFNLEHFDTGRLIEKIINDPKERDNPIVQREKKLFEAGILCTPEWVTEMVKQEIKNLHQQGKGIIFTGSPRTLYEAKAEIPFLEELYGQDKIFILKINVKPETSIFRNSHRRICQKCGHVVVYSPENEKLEKCLLCGGKLVRRGALDKPETIKVRLKEYEQRTMPIFDYLEKRGFKLIEINGEPSPDEVTEEIFRKLKATSIDRFHLDNRSKN